MDKAETITNEAQNEASIRAPGGTKSCGKFNYSPKHTPYVGVSSAVVS